MPPIIVTTRALIIHSNKLLMCKLKHNHDFYCLPGGKLDPGETIEAGLERELIEETGIKPVIGQLAFINQFINAENHRIEFFFLVSNGADYANFDPSQGSHAFEIADFKMTDPTDPQYNLMPAFIRDRFAGLCTQGNNVATEVITSN
jgi:ADP-ribose pyrophosphatase YjhB (NUDIX family)